ncbi:leucine-rich repeat domain-containing protein [Anaerostipes sp.]|uniref:leucine-rich repeat domain-containing protein n=1 Tax=Anaerostipes sp. TaxID=1872530 RepID=UPI0025C34D09|nr:leucine-rich repeat domain-containing protein [Anaerostipes sp.]MBS7009862.1 leucine-rich repeat protein [Anaerostipes sp.]
MELKEKRLRKRLAVCLLASMLLGGNISSPFRVQASENAAVKTGQKIWAQNKAAVRGDMLDESGKPSGVTWDFEAASGKLTISGKGLPCGFKSEYDGGPTAPWFPYKENIKKIEISSGVEPESMAYWFYGCKNLSEAPKLPDSVKNMDNTFWGCEKLEKAPEFPARLESADGTFRFCTELKTAPRIPESAKNLPAVFYNCENLELPDGFQIPKGAENLRLMFTGCYKLKHLPSGFRIPEHAKYLDGMFWNCIGLKDAPKLSQNAESAEWMFAGCALEKLPDDFQLPKKIKNINGLFIGNNMLNELPENFTIPDGAEDAAEMFSGCDNLTRLPKGFQIPGSVQKTDSMFKVDSGTQKIFLPYDSESLIKYSGWKSDGRTVILYCTVKFQDISGKNIKNVDINMGDSLGLDQIPKAPEGCHWNLPNLKNIKTDLTVKAEKNYPAPQTPQEKGPAKKKPKKKLPIKKAVKSGRQIKVKWKKKKGAKGYAIYYSTKKKGKYKKIAVVGKRSNTKVILKSGRRYYFKARPFVKKKNGKVRYKKFIKAKKKELNKVVRVTYRNAAGYKRYEVWMKVGKKKYKKVKTFYHGGTLTYIKQKAKTGKRYRFLLKAGTAKKGGKTRVIK